MSVKSGQDVASTFRTANPTTGADADATGTPTATLYVNGTANAATVTVTKPTGTGLYAFLVTLPTLSAGDILRIEATATVATVTGSGTVWEGVADTVRLSDCYAVVSNATYGNAALKTGIDAATTAAAGGYIDGDTLVTQATLVGGVAIGRTTAGATVTAYLSTDTTRSTPKRQSVADEDGDWSLYLTGGSTYTLVFSKSGYSEATQNVTVA